jgi:membrane-bound metal-dependent hydrolase YbcI (DUF457 family)
MAGAARRPGLDPVRGVSHVTTGVVAGLATAPLVTSGPYETALWCAAVGGAAMWPDIDHPSATIARTFGPVTTLLSRLAFRLSGGHRKGTHSLAFAAASGVVAHLAAWASPVAGGVLLVLFIGLGLRGANAAVPRHQRINVAVHFAVATGAVLLAYGQGLTLGWLGAAVALGSVTHLAGDCLTEAGCPLFRPWSRRSYGIPLTEDRPTAEPAIIAAVNLAGVAMVVDRAGWWPVVVRLDVWATRLDDRMLQLLS